MVNMTLVKSLVLFVFLTVGLFAQANPSKKNIEYSGQSIEELILENKLIETRYRTETQDSTCERQVPYEDQDCHMEPRYDEVCTTIPGRNDCRTEYDRQCRTETDYRQECTRDPSRQVCRNVRRTRQECTTGRATRTCRREPAREQCRTNRSGERVCRNIPGREVCNSKPGQRTCRSVPYNDRVCETERGSRTCRQVPHRREVCNNVPRQACDWIPSRQQCDTVRVGEDQICVDVTRYRTEEYACQIEVEIPYEVTAKEYEAKCLINFKAGNYKDQFSFDTILDKNGAISFKKTSEANTPVAFAKNKIKKEQEGKLERISAKINLSLYDTEEVYTMLFPVSEVALTKEKLSFELPFQKIASSFKMFLRIKDGDNKLISRKVLDSEFEIKKVADKFKVIIGMKDISVKLEDFKVYNYAIKLTPVFKEKLVFPLDQKIEFKTEGDLTPVLSESDLDAFKSSLDQVSKIDFSTKTLGFEVPNHHLIKDIKVKLKAGGFEGVVEKDQITLTSTESVISAKVNAKDIGQVWSALSAYPLEISVTYIFEESNGLPADFSLTTTRSAELKPTLTQEEIALVKKDAQSITSFKLRKKSVEFIIKNNEYLTDLDLKISIKYKSKVKLDKVLTLEDYVLEDLKSKSKVVIDLEKLNVKLANRSRYNVVIEMVRKTDSELNNGTQLNFATEKKYRKKPR